MKLVLDTHVHTIPSGHAYSTIKEYVEIAKDRGIELIGFTDHGPEMPGGPHMFHIGNQFVIPREIEGITILRGVEANIMDYNGSIDIPERLAAKLDVIIASLHDVVLEPGTMEENTNALLRVMDNPHVDIIGHPGNPAYPIDIDRFVSYAKEKNVLIEINNRSFIADGRKGSYDNCKAIAQKAKDIGAKVIAGSDSHICYTLCCFEKVEEIFNEIDMPEELIMNTSGEKFINHLKGKGKLTDL